MSENMLEAIFHHQTLLSELSDVNCDDDGGGISLLPTSRQQAEMAKKGLITTAQMAERTENVAEQGSEP